MNRVARALHVRADDVAVLSWLVALFAATQAGHGLGSNAGDALLFVRYGVGSLPPMIAVSGLVIMVVTVAYAAAMSRVGPARLLPAVAWGLAGLLVVERVLVVADRPVVYAVIWLTEQVVVLVTFTMMWGAAGEACDTRRAKRLFPLLASAGIGGGFVGNLLTGPLAGTLGTPDVLLAHALLLAVTAVLIRQVAARFFTSPAAVATTAVGARPRVRVPTRRAAGALDDLRAGLRATGRSPLFRLTSVVAFAFSLLFFLVVVPFAEIVTASFAGDAEVAAFLGFFSAAATAASFVVSLLVTNRLLASFGVVVVVLVVPVVYALGFSLWAVSFSLVAAATVRGAQWIAVNAVGGTAWQSLFNVVRPPVRGQVMAFVTAVPTQLGVAAGGAALTVGIADLPIRWLALVGAAVAIGALAVGWRMRAAYVDDLLVALRGGLDDLFASVSYSPRPPALGAVARRMLEQTLTHERVERRRAAVGVLGLVDAAPTDLLLTAAHDTDGLVRAAAVDRLAGADDPRAGATVAAALGDVDQRVRRAAVRAVGRLGPRGATRATALLGDPDPGVRAAAAAVVRDGDACRVLEELLTSSAQMDVAAALDAVATWPDAPLRPAVEVLTSDPRPTVRLGAATALVARDVTGPALRLLDDRERSVREGAARLLRGRADATDALVAVVRDGPPRAQQAAVTALRGAAAAQPAVTTWAIGRAERAEVVRGYRAQLRAVAVAVTPSHAYLDRVLAQREWAAVRAVLSAVETLAGSDEAHLLIRGVQASDPQLRAQAIEAIDSLAERPLTRQVVPLLEGDAPVDAVAAGSAGDVTRWSVLDDADEWLRALGVRAAIDQIGALRSLVSHHARRDGSRLVADALGSAEEVAVPSSDRSSGLIDRILALQQVPMFSDLPPEDLQQIAEHCSAHTYAADEVVFHQGDVGDEMLIVTRGRVRVSREADGAVEVVRRFGPGDHVGELSLLRDRPRVAAVIADEEGADGLSLDAGAFRAIIAGRPEVAMAMLATLAERLGTQ